MTSSHSSVYSQGFNFNSFIDKGVDARTGQYTCSIELYEAPTQVRNCAPFKLSLVYNPLNTRNDGLGVGWSFNLSSYSQRTLLLSTGENYQCTESGSSFYVNDQKLKSFDIKKIGSGYEVAYKSGVIEVLSNDRGRYDRAVPIALYAPNGRSLQFEWTSRGGVPGLTKVKDGSEDLLHVTYLAAAVHITRAPNTPEVSTFILQLRNDQLTEVHPPLADTDPWKFSYDTYGRVKCISAVTSPTGLTEQVNYKRDGHRLPNRAPYQTIPHVISHISRPGRQQPAITTLYRYSSTNFLGYGGGVDWAEGQDNLYLARGDYSYTSTVEVEGGPTTAYTYNKFHLTVKIVQQKNTSRVTQTFDYYALPSVEFKNQPAQYLSPKTLTIEYQDTANDNKFRTETTTYAFDEWGNPLQEVQPDGVTINRTYYPPTGEEDLCPADPRGFQRHMKSETVVPAQSNYSTPIRSEKYTYLELPTAFNAITDYFVAVKELEAEEGGVALSNAAYTYVNQPGSRDHGRPEKQITWVSQEKATTQKWTYQYVDSGLMKQCIAIDSFDGLSSQDVTDYSLHSGQTLAHKDHTDVQDTFEYDRPEDGQGSRLVVTDTNGVKTRYIADSLGRLCEVEKQDRDSSSEKNTDVFRKVQKRNYNGQDQCIEMIEIDWLRIEGGGPLEQQRSRVLEYDNWGEVYRTTEDTGVVTISETDPVALTTTEGIEGQGLTKTHRNTLGLIIKVEMIQRDGQQYSQVEYFYDGLGRLRQQKDALGRLTKFECDGFDRVTKTTWPDSREITTLYSAQTASAWPESVSINGLIIGEQSFDGLGRTYRGNGPEPDQITTNKGDQSNFAVAGDDATDAYEYDPKSGIPRVLKGAYSTQVLKHFPSGFLEMENIKLNRGGTFSTTYKYSMAGKLQDYTDVNGQRHVVEYDSFGRMKQLIQGMLKVSYSYDGAGRLSETQVHDEGRSSITTRLVYDEFGREVERTVLQATKTLYRLMQSYGKTSLQLRDETFEYDANNRLVNYTCQGSLSPTDEYGRQLNSQRFSFDAYGNLVEVVTGFQGGGENVATYSFSSQDPTQLTSLTNTHPELPPRVETRQRRTLEYDSRSRLTAVRDADYNIISQYHYDTTGRLVCQSVPGQADHHLFYRGDKLIATQRGDQKISYMCDGEGYWGQSVQDGDGTTQTQLWSSNGYDSVLAWIDGHQPDQVRHQKYTAYGSGNTETSIGFNGQWRDPVTGWYHLGNGYRVYNPVLMRFHSPDSWSPFTSGEINPYAYCLGDPVNRVDPSGHWGFFKKIGNWFKKNWKMVVGTVLAVAASIVVGVMTAGLSVAAQIGASIAVGAVVEAGWGAASKAIDGEPITFGSVLKDALVGGVAGAFTEFASPVMALATGSWPLVESLAPSPRDTGISSARSGSPSLGNVGSLTVRDAIRPALKTGDSNDQGGLPLAEPGSTSLLSSGGGDAVADALNLELRCVFLSKGSPQYRRQNAGNSSLEILEQMRSTHKNLRLDIRGLGPADLKIIRK
ncbi:hypothetical protein GGI35DRAFT_468131 [Trichoderma velutinum]